MFAKRSRAKHESETTRNWRTFIKLYAVCFTVLVLRESVQLLHLAKHSEEVASSTTLETLGANCSKTTTDSSTCADCSTAGEDKEQRETSSDKFWFNNVPMPPIIITSSENLPEGACKHQLHKYSEELNNGTLWATQMFDASVKYPTGIIDGQTRHFGSFDQCYKINARVSKKDNENAFEDIRGKYCLVDYKYEQTGSSADIPDKLLKFDPHDSAWSVIKDKEDFRRIKRHILQIAICVPAACSVDDIQKALQGPYHEYGLKNNLIVTVSIDKNNCQTQLDERRFSTGAKIYSLILLGLFALVVVSSIYDSGLSKKKKEQVLSRNAQLLLCFSARRNIRSIFEVQYRHPGLDTIHLFRFLSMCLVIIGHRSLLYYYNPVVNEYYLEETFDVPSNILIHNGPTLTDGFFAIGGLLTCYGLLNHLDNNRQADFVGIIFLRFLRLTPLYASVIFFYVHILPHLGSGPQWPSIIGSQADNCASTWWASLCYLNTYLTMDRICMFQTWYLCVDFHCFLISLVLIYWFWKQPRRIGFTILGIAVFISILIPFYITYAHRLQPIMLASPRTLISPAMDSYFVNYYVKTHIRMTPYFLGVITGAILHDQHKNPWIIPKKFPKRLCTLLLWWTCTILQALAYPYLNPNSKQSRITMALYSSLHHSIYALGVCSIILFVTMRSGKDSHRRFLSPGWAQPLSRLTYGAFLSHNIVQLYQAGTLRSAKTFSFHNLFWDFVPDIVYTFLIAFAMAVVIEGPLRRIEKCFIISKVESGLKNDHKYSEELIDESPKNC